MTRRHDRFLAALGLAAALSIAPCAQAAATPGTWLQPFAGDSLWNSRPVNPAFGSFVIPKSSYFPAVAEGGYSTGVFRALTTDKAILVAGPVGKPGIWDADAEVFRASVRVAHWPAGVIPAEGTDGHADIVDEANGVIHSFSQLRNVGGVWRARQYAWAPLKGRGWGDPAHYYQGARATAVPTSAGLIRKHEIADGDTQYRHALAMSLTFNGLAGGATPYVFPATSADSVVTSNTGKIPEGSLLMLPPGFDTARITNAKLKKVAETLKTYGAYVVDRNSGTPFVIYVEKGSDFGLHKNGWDAVAAAELDMIRQGLRPVVAVSGWRSKAGALFKPTQNLNLMSMRGNWGRQGGNGSAAFDSLQQAVVVQPGSAASTFVNVGNRNITTTAWARPVKGKAYRLTAKASGGAMLRLDVVAKSTGKTVYSSGFLGNGASTQFAWPATDYVTVVTLWTPAGQAASASAILLQA